MPHRSPQARHVPSATTPTTASSRTDDRPQPAPSPAPPRLLITAGPTHEPIDQVRFIGNRSSGRLGVALADAAAALGWPVTLLLGPTSLLPSDSRIRTVRFRSTADLQALLREHLDDCDILVMAAAVADYRPRRPEGPVPAKLRREAATLTLELEPTPDLVAECVARKRPGQTIVGFALEPADQLMASARSKLARKGLDLIVANPLETMESDVIEAWLIAPDGTRRHTDGRISKVAFAPWLLAALGEAIGTATDGPASGGGHA